MYVCMYVCISRGYALAVKYQDGNREDIHVVVLGVSSLSIS